MLNEPVLGYRIGAPLNVAADTTPLHVEIFRDEFAWLQLESDWRRLCDESPPDSAYCRWPWVSAWWKSFGGSDRVPFVVVVRQANCIVGIVPFVLERPPQFWRPTRVRPMGYHRRPDLHSLTEVPVQIVQQGFEEVVRAKVLETLRNALRSGLCDGFLYQHILPIIETTEFQSGAQQGIYEWTKRKAGPLWVRLPSTWAAYRKQVSRSMRDNLAYYPRLLERSGFTWQVLQTNKGAGFTEALDNLIRLHHLRAQGEATHEDYLVHPCQQQLLREGLTQLAAEEAAMVACLVVDGQVIAAQAFLRSNHTLTVLYSGFDPAWSKFSPLLVIQGQVFKESLESGVQIIDFLQGRAAWQVRWAGHAEVNIIKHMAIRIHPLSLMRGFAYLVRRELAKPGHRTRSIGS